MAVAPRQRRLLAWLLLALLLGVASSLAQGGPPRAVEAHALLERADPPINSQLREPPTTLTLYFSEALEHKFSSVQVTDNNNQRLDKGVTFDDSDPTVMRVALKTVSPGYLTVNWENVSAVDGHRITGTYPLTILNPDGSVPAGQPPGINSGSSGANPDILRVVVKFILLVAASALTGALAFLFWVTPSLPVTQGSSLRDRIDRVVLLAATGALLGLVIAGVAELALQSREIHSSIATAIDTRWGQRWLFRNALLALPLVAVLVASRSRALRGDISLGGLAGMAGYMLLVSSVSHGAAGQGAFWATTSDFVHLLASAVWVGMLTFLGVFFWLSRRHNDRAERFAAQAFVLQRFSAVAVLSLALLLFTGVANAVIEVGHLSDLINTGYGRALLLKLVLIVPLLFLGAGNAYLLRPRFIYALEEPARLRNAVMPGLEQRLGRTIRYEAIAAVAVLAAVALLVQLTPTRGFQNDSTPAGTLTLNQTSGDLAVTLVIDPNQPGINTFEVYLAGPADDVERVRLNISPKGKPDEEAYLIMDPSNYPTFYVGSGPYLGQAGTWNVNVDLRRTKGVDALLPFEVKVPPAAGQAVANTKGGTFASPIQFSAEAAALLLVSGILALAIIVASRPQPDLAAGYAGEAAERAVEIVGPRLRSTWSLAALLVIGIGMGLILGNHVHSRLSPEEATGKNPVPASEASIARGRELFTQNCTQCHGETGRGDGPLAATLPLQPANFYLHVPYHPDDYFFNVLSFGVGGAMPSFGQQLSEEDRWNIINFLRATFSADPATQ